MSNIVRGGFHPLKGIGQVPRPRRYEVASGNGTAVFPGDCVDLVTAGVVQPSAAGGNPGAILGVVAHVSYVNVQNFRVYGPYIPASTTYSPTARGSVNASYAYIWDDPSIEYVASLASNAGTNTAALIYAAVGANMDLVATAGSTVYGRSGHQLDGNPIAGTANFRILAVYRDPAQDLASANARVVCMINEGFHAFTSAAGV